MSDGRKELRAILWESADSVLAALSGTHLAPLTKFKARSQMIAEEVLPLQIGVNY